MKCGLRVRPLLRLPCSAVRYSIFDIRRFFVFTGLAAVLTAITGCGLFPDQSFHVPNSEAVLRYPAGWTASPNTARIGLSTVFSPDASPGPRSTRIVLMRGTITPEPPPGPGATLTAPVLGGGDPKHDRVQIGSYTERGTIRPENLRGSILSQDLGRNAEGLRVSRFIIQPDWAIEVYAPPAEFATIRTTAERMAAALNVKDKPRPPTPGAIKPADLKK